MKRKNLISESKRGSMEAVLNVVWFVIVLFILAVITFAGDMIFDDINTDMQADADLHNISKEVVGDSQARYNSVMDGLFVFFFFLAWMMLLVMAYFTPSHPVLLVFMIIIFIFVGYVVAELGNAYAEISEDSLISETVAKYPMLNFINTNMLSIGIVIIISIISTIFIRVRLD